MVMLPVGWFCFRVGFSGSFLLYTHSRIIFCSFMSDITDVFKGITLNLHITLGERLTILTIHKYGTYLHCFVSSISATNVS